ncbi:hypothetical protein CRUP_037673 [Coryphaenoides rupestris]|nr:hypothetical protein CRUP_037673 [Coryphaenoides rupestris]
MIRQHAKLLGHNSYWTYDHAASCQWTKCDHVCNNNSTNSSDWTTGGYQWDCFNKRVDKHNSIPFISDPVDNSSSSQPSHNFCVYKWVDHHHNGFAFINDPPLCCLGLNNTCRRGDCFCDVACLRLNDCCSDFNTTCVTGNCSAGPPTCCPGSNFSCFHGCFCDENCVAQNDCCPDYNDTCRTANATTVPPSTSDMTPVSPTTTPEEPSEQNVILAMSVSLLAPANFSTKAAIEQALSHIMDLVRDITGVEYPFKILKIQLK